MNRHVMNQLMKKVKICNVPFKKIHAVKTSYAAAGVCVDCVAIVLNCSYTYIYSL